MCKLKPFPYNDNFATVQIYLNPSIYTVTFPQTTFTISYKNIFSIYFVQKKVQLECDNIYNSNKMAAAECPGDLRI